jgi:hypothetical protein
MSDNYLRIIPAEPKLVPPEAVATRILALVRPAFPEADTVAAESHPHPVFVDQGANLEAVLCAACRRRLQCEPTAEASAVWDWWLDLADRLRDGSVADVQVTMPCCQAVVPFTALEFDWPAGVASFEISIMNPGVSGGPSVDLQRQLEVLIGCPIKCIWAHY